MAKVITQQTFDDVVKENISEFDMTPEEAVEDAIAQFESQGVNLLNIIKDANIYKNGDTTVHPVTEALNKLKVNTDQTEVIESLKLVKSECEKDLATRCLAGKPAYEVLIKYVEENKENADLLRESLQALISLTDGQPDVIDQPGMVLCMGMLEMHAENTEILKLVIKFIRTVCIKHEGNRQAFVKLKLINELSEILKKYKEEGSLVKETCAMLRTLTFDDDIRVPFGQAHEHAKMIVIEGDALETLLDVCKRYASDPEVLSELLATISKLVVRNEFCKAVMDMGGLDFILAAFQESMSNKDIVKQALGVIKALAGNDDVKIGVVKAGGIDVILSAMTKHQANSKVAELACATIATLVLRNPGHCSKVMESNGHIAILQAMKIHANQDGVQKQCCVALRNIVARSREHCVPILELGAEPLINQAKQQHPTCADDAKAALRDLGCHVELKELWKGEKPGLVQE